MTNKLALSLRNFHESCHVLRLKCQWCHDCAFYSSHCNLLDSAFCRALSHQFPPAMQFPQRPTCAWRFFLASLALLTVFSEEMTVPSWLKGSYFFGSGGRGGVTFVRGGSAPSRPLPRPTPWFCVHLGTLPCCTPPPCYARLLLGSEEGYNSLLC